MTAASTPRSAHRLSAQSNAEATVSRPSLAVEEPLQIQLDCNPIAITMRTPGSDSDLALGFLYAEGIVTEMAQVARIVASEEATGDTELSLANVVPVPDASLTLIRALELRRGTLTTSACGVCGRQSIDDLLERCVPLPPGPVVSSALLCSLPGRLASRQPVFDETGGAHAAAVFTTEGELLAVAEDVGRHNAVDKVVGALLRRGLAPVGTGEPRPAVLMVSGRASFEIVQKAAVARIPIVASVSAASSLAVDLARACRMTLAAFVRDGRAELYANDDRVRSG